MVQQTPLRVHSCAPISRSKLKTRSAHADSPIPKLKKFHLKQFSYRTSICFTDQETQGENLFGATDSITGPLLCTYLSFKVQDPFSARRQSNF